MNNQNKKPEDDDVTFDMYHLFSRWDFILLVLFVLLTLVLTISIFFKGQAV